MQNSLEPNPPCEESPVCSETTRSSPTAVSQEVHLVESLFFEGRKAMLLFKYKEASQKFGDASKLLAKTHGSLSPQCADALFLYGQALFGSSVQRNSVVKKVGITTENLNDSEFVLNLENELELERGVHQEDTEDFENAWHNLDLAREIYRRIDTVDAKLKLAEVVMVLGDIAMEAENCRQALSEYVESLSLKQLFLKPDDRNLADAYCKVALTYENISNLPQAILHLELAQRTMIRRIQTAKHELDILDRVIGKGKAKAPPEHEDPYLLIEREIAEIATSIREVSLKIDDLRSIEANSALCLELALNDSELLPDIATYPASLEESNQGTCEIELNEFNHPVSREGVEDSSGENEKKRYLTEELNSSNSAGKKTKI